MHSLGDLDAETFLRRAKSPQECGIFLHGHVWILILDFFGFDQGVGIHAMDVKDVMDYNPLRNLYKYGVLLSNGFSGSWRLFH